MFFLFVYLNIKVNETPLSHFIYSTVLWKTVLLDVLEHFRDYRVKNSELRRQDY